MSETFKGKGVNSFKSILVPKWTCGFSSVSLASPLDKSSRTFWMRLIIAYETCGCFSCRLNLTTSCWGWLQELFHLTSQAGCWGLLVGQMWIQTFIISLFLSFFFWGLGLVVGQNGSPYLYLPLQGQLGQEDGGGLNANPGFRSVCFFIVREWFFIVRGLFLIFRGWFFYCLRIVLPAFVIVLSRFALNDAGRSMVAALVARILEDPQLGDEQIRLSWTTTVGEARIDSILLKCPLPRLLVELFHKCLILSHGTEGFFPIYKIYLIFRSSTTLECSTSIQHITIPRCLIFLFTMEGAWNTPLRCGNRWFFDEN